MKMLTIAVLAGAVSFGLWSYRTQAPGIDPIVSGSIPGKPLPGENWGPSLYCAVIVKTVDAQTRAKTGINDLLRD